jgi:hypothetical protein
MFNEDTEHSNNGFKNIIDVILLVTCNVKSSSSFQMAGGLATESKHAEQ